MSRFSGRSKSAIRGDIQRRISLAHKNLIATTRQLTNADSLMMRQAGAVLQKHIKKQLATPAANLRTALKADEKGRRRMYGTPSAPGQSPRKITGALARGVKNKVVEGERQVRAENFKSKIHEFGYVAPERPARTTKYRKPPKKNRDGSWTAGELRSKQSMTKPRRAQSQAPRPFMRPGMEAAKPELAKVGAVVLRDGVQKALAARAGGLSGH